MPSTASDDEHEAWDAPLRRQTVPWAIRNTRTRGAYHILFHPVDIDILGPYDTRLKRTATQPPFTHFTYILPTFYLHFNYRPLVFLLDPSPIDRAYRVRRISFRRPIRNRRSRSLQVTTFTGTIVSRGSSSLLTKGTRRHPRHPVSLRPARCIFIRISVIISNGLHLR